MLITELRVCDELMKSFICIDCKKVFLCAIPQCICGGDKVELFDSKYHGHLLVPMSNAWQSIWSAWQDHPQFKKIQNNLRLNNSFSATHVINKFIEIAIKKLEEDEEI